MILYSLQEQGNTKLWHLSPPTLFNMYDEKKASGKGRVSGNGDAPFTLKTDETQTRKKSKKNPNSQKISPNSKTLFSDKMIISEAISKFGK